MTATLPDGRVVIWTAHSPHLSGDPDLVAKVRAYLAARERVHTSMTGPSVPADEGNRFAVVTAVTEIADVAGIRWENPPDLSFGLRPGTNF